MRADAYRDGDVLVVRRNALLPEICVCCGQPAHAKRTKQGFHWRPREYYLLWIYSWLGILVLVTIARERMVLLVPLCPTHRLSYRLARWLAYALLLGAIPVAVAWGVVTDWDTANWDQTMEVMEFIVWMMVAMGLVVLILFRSPLRAAYLSGTHGYFIGAGGTFLDSLSSETNPEAEPYSG